MLLNESIGKRRVIIFFGRGNKMKIIKLIFLALHFFGALVFSLREENFGAIVIVFSVPLLWVLDPDPTTN